MGFMRVNVCFKPINVVVFELQIGSQLIVDTHDGRIIW